MLSHEASHYLSELFTNVHIPNHTIRNTVARRRKCDDDASTFVSALRKKKARGELEYLRIYLDEDTGVLKSVIWTFRGSKQCVQKLWGYCFWDSTHNMTRYDYKVSFFTIIGSEGCSGAVSFCLFLSETAERCEILLAAWHEAFEMRLPRVIFTHGDEQCTPLLHLFHILQMLNI